MTPCARCGAFAELQQLDGAGYCAACAARPEVGAIEKLRAARLGNRDVWAWTVGALAPWSLWIGYGHAGAGLWPLTLLWLFLAGAQVSFWMGQTWARQALLPLLIGVPVILVGTQSAFMNQAFTFVMPIAVCVAAHRDPINRLFFLLPVPDAKLARVVKQTENNPLARNAYQLASIALFVPPLLPVAVVMAIVALAHVDARATPPVGRGLALRALLVGLAVPLAYGCLFVVLYQVFQGQH